MKLVLKTLLLSLGILFLSLSPACGNSDDEENGGAAGDVHCMNDAGTTCTVWFEESSCIFDDESEVDECLDESDPDYAGNCTVRKEDNSGPLYTTYYYYGTESSNRTTCDDVEGYFAAP